MQIILMAFILGFKHAYDADHLLAVSNFLISSPGIVSTAAMSLSWALGHMLTAGIITLLLQVTFSQFIVSYLSYLEIAVGFMLIILGVLSIVWEFGQSHTHPHRHEKTTHSHRHVHLFGLRRHFHPRLFTAGVIQGLASNDELFTLLVISLGVVSLYGMLLNVGIFSLGVAAGMLSFGYMVKFPMKWIGTGKVKRIIAFFVGAISILYGLLLLMGLPFSP